MGDATNMQFPPNYHLSDPKELISGQLKPKHSSIQLKNITADLKNYLYETSYLDIDTATRGLDIILKPPANKYTRLKSRLVDTFQLIECEATARILDMNGLGDAKPTEILD